MCYKKFKFLKILIQQFFNINISCVSKTDYCVGQKENRIKRQVNRVSRYISRVSFPVYACLWAAAKREITQKVLEAPAIASLGSLYSVFVFYSLELSHFSPCQKENYRKSSFSLDISTPTWTLLIVHRQID